MMMMYTDIVQEMLLNPTSELITYLIIAAHYIILLTLYYLPVYAGIMWLILGLICDKFGRLDSAIFCYTITVLICVIGLIVEIFLK